MARSTVIGILSGKGGVGKTTITANLGAALAHDFGRKALVIDSNIKTSHLGLHFGVYDEFPVTLRDVLDRKVPPMYAIYMHPASGLRMLPAPMKDGSMLRNMDAVVGQLRRTYDPIIVDCAPGLGSDAIIAAKAIDKAIIVTTPDLPAFTDALKTIDLLKRLRKDVLGIVMNRVRGERYELTREEIEQTSGQEVIAVIPETTRIPESIAAGSPIVISSNSGAAAEFKKLAAAIAGVRYVPDGIFGRLANVFGRLANVFNFNFSALDGARARKETNVFVREAAAGGESDAVEVPEAEGYEEGEPKPFRAQKIKPQINRTGGAWKSARSAARYINPRRREAEAAEHEVEAVADLRRGLPAAAKPDNMGPYRGFARSGAAADMETEILRKVKARLKAKLGR
ncbi:MAG: P-loop NTPase [Candidatus Aenigmatarchaeota archaeon]